MGFNNGYESGYEDAKAESVQKINALEARIAELEAGGGAPTPTPTPTPTVLMLKLDGSNVKGEIVWPGGTAQYGGKFTAISATRNNVGSEEEPEYFIMLPQFASGDIVVLTEDRPRPDEILAGEDITLAGDNGPGVYSMYYDDENLYMIMSKIAPLSALVL